MKKETLKHFVVLFFLVLALGACTSKKFDGPVFLGGQLVSAQKLNVGYDTYMQYCYQCHGVEGDGMGPAAIGSNPPPRNFKQGLFKFGNINTGELPSDEDLKHTIRYGLRGTQMLPWDVSDERLDAVVQYIKTFSPRWTEEKPGEALVKTPDPYGPARRSEAIELGKKIYHGVAQCYTCHPAYGSFDEVNQWTKELTGNEISELRADAHLSLNQDSSYGHKFMPPDFTKNWIKTGGDVDTLYQLLGAGVGGTTMPAWKNSLSSAADDAERAKENELRLWALSYYVSSLHELMYDWRARRDFVQTLQAKRQNQSRQ